MIYYNPNAIGGASIIDGDQHSTETLTVALAHEIGHTHGGRAALGLQVIPPDIDPSNPDVAVMGGLNKVLEETRAVHYFENPVRTDLGLPPRTSYYNVGDVQKKWGVGP